MAIKKQITARSLPVPFVLPHNELKKSRLCALLSGVEGQPGLTLRSLRVRDGLPATAEFNLQHSNRLPAETRLITPGPPSLSLRAPSL